jgi:hypothetical protein
VVSDYGDDNNVGGGMDGITVHDSGVVLSGENGNYRTQLLYYYLFGYLIGLTMNQLARTKHPNRV